VKLVKLRRQRELVLMQFSHPSVPHMLQTSSNPILELNVIGVDIRQDLGRPYSAFLIQAKYGSKRWTVEKRFSEFYAFDQKLRKTLAKANFLPPPLKRTFLQPGPQEIENRKNQLNDYLHTLSVFIASHAQTSQFVLQQAEEQSEQAHWHAVHDIYDFVRFVECSASVERISTVQYIVERNEDSDDDQLAAATAADLPLLQEIKADTRRLQEELADLSLRAEAETNVKRGIACRTRTLSDEIKKLQDLCEIAARRQLECEQGPTSNADDAVSAARLAARLRAAAIAACAPSPCVGSPHRTTQLLGSAARNGNSSAAITCSSVSSQEPTPGAEGAAGEVGLESVEAAAADLLASPAHGGRGWDRLMSVQAAQLLKENAVLWKLAARTLSAFRLTSAAVREVRRLAVAVEDQEEKTRGDLQQLLPDHLRPRVFFPAAPAHSISSLAGSAAASGPGYLSHPLALRALDALPLHPASRRPLAARSPHSPVVSAWQPALAGKGAYPSAASAPPGAPVGSAPLFKPLNLFPAAALSAASSPHASTASAAAAAAAAG